MHILEAGKELPDPMTRYLAVDRSRPKHECWVTGHMVAGLDGTAAIEGKVGALSTDVDQTFFRRMRQIADVVLVGAETVRREGYGLVRLSDEAKQQRQDQGKPPTPPVAVVSGSLDLNWDLKLFSQAPDHAQTIVVTTDSADPDRLAEARKHTTVMTAGEHRVDPQLALRKLAKLGHGVVLCEGGPTLLGEFIVADRLDELCLSIAPLMGGDNLPVAVTPSGSGLTRFELKSVMSEDQTLFLRYESHRRHDQTDD